MEKWLSIFWAHNFTKKVPSISLTSDVVNTYFWFLTLSVISNNNFYIAPPYLYLWVDIGILLCFYYLEQFVIKKLSYFFVLIHINFKCLSFSGTSLKGILMTLPSQMVLLVFTQTIEPSVMIYSSLSKYLKTCHLNKWIHKIRLNQHPCHLFHWSLLYLPCTYSRSEERRVCTG